MTKLLLSIHVLVAILAVGSITVAASMFPRQALRAIGGEGPGVTALLHRVCRGYAVAGIAVPVFGIATGAQLGVLGDAWLIVSLVLTGIAAALLGLVILPGQRSLLALAEGQAPSGESTGNADAAADAAERAEHAQAAARPVAARLAMLTGIFNVLWAVVVVLMIVRPSSTTGA
ncbi:hypothetical protein DMA15_15095 [Streptomyces sp. WAC 01529]|uniref:hypothetical protein n=1 Tax=Streptomyces sp. WAC 01529 TaxID=2203205 RepID=UPI000F6BA205|nr:hypothetical protein [Streptomyces sp. WAC 01529]AZM53739.1 hypothetical protein DMA15_15095 [Streptomyces sp. WAC 01529]